MMMKVEEPFDPDTISIEQLEERIRDVQEEAYQFKKLGESAAWLAFASAVQSNARVLRSSKGGRVLASFDDGLAHNYDCGRADGLDRAISLREEIVQEIEQVLVEMRELLEEKTNAKAAYDLLESERASGDGDTGELFPDGHSSGNGDANGEQFAP